MGSVFLATDLHTGQAVALKLMHAAGAPAATHRFSREAQVLAELRHPAIVSYVAHGTSHEGQPFLAMEWLAGEDLSRRLLRQPLSLAETLSLLRRAAEALATAHQQGIVHRDIKPSNLFLRQGNPADVVLLDFGLARHVIPSLVGITSSGMVLGTPGYMAPEQASSQHEIPPAADIFSLGCVLYECLAGRPPFAAPHFAAALAKILYAEPTPLRTLRAQLPAGLQELVDQMLVKDARQRLPDATRLVASLATLGSLSALAPPDATQSMLVSGLAHAEQQLVSVLLVTVPEVPSEPRKASLARGLALRDSVRAMLEPFGAQVELLADGSLVATLVPTSGTATDQAALAARCALTFKQRLPEAAVVLATGLGVVDQRLPVGEVMDRAGQLLRRLEQEPASSTVMMDETTAGLLGPDFELSRSASGAFLLQGGQASADASRPLLGKPTPCVGREQELALLELTLTTCAEEPCARGVLVTAPAGVGKSRLRHEFLRRVERRQPPVLVMLGRGDPISVGAAQGLLGQAVKRLCEISEGQELEARRARLARRVALHLPAAEARETVELLGELCAIPFPDEANPRLRAARSDPRLLSVQIGRALVSFLKAECAHQPVLLVLEDLHWSDALTLRVVDELLRELADEPFMVLALARPEVKTAFPGLWQRRFQEVPLNGLGRRASARLVREVLGEGVPEHLVQRAVEQSDGNALLLEELIRMVAEGRQEAVPETVLAVLRARLLRMEPTLRQALLAASVFGRAFWLGAVRELLDSEGRQRLEERLLHLVEQEIIEPLGTSRFIDEQEYRFRHALLRDAAYGLLPEAHRATGHRLAGAWLERAGETDPVVLATHHQLGQQPERAVYFYVQAAEQLFERHDQQGTLRCVEAALACGVEGEALQRLRAVQAVVAFWMEQLPRVLEFGGGALSGLKPGSRLWCRLMMSLIYANFSEGNFAETFSLSDQLMHTLPEPEATAVHVEALTFLGASMAWTGARQMMEIMVGRIAEVSRDVMAQDVMARGWVRYLEAYFHYYFEPSPWKAAQVAELAWRDFREVTSERNAVLLQNLLGAALAALGDLPAAEARLREALILAQRLEQPRLIGMARHYLATALANSPEQAHQEEARVMALEGMIGPDEPVYRQGIGNAVLAQVLAASGKLSEAEEHARKACELLVTLPTLLGFGRTVLSNVLRARGRAAEARREAEPGVQDLEQMESSGVYAVALRLALAEACLAEGDVSAGEAALRKALQCVRARASDIADPAARERFLRQLPENARTLELARQRWGET
jgi:hypothetical protein